MSGPLRRSRRAGLTGAGLALAGLIGLLPAQTPTVGTLLNTPSSVDGYTLFAPTGARTTYLVDNCGRLVRTWESDHLPGLVARLLPGGILLRAGRIPAPEFQGGGLGGIVERFAWDGTLLDACLLASDSVHAHHDVFPLPGGTYLAVQWERHSAAEAIARGRDPELTPEWVWSERVVEVDPETCEVEVVWRVWDHLVQNTDPALPDYGEPADHPDRFDINFAAALSGGGMGPGGGALAAADWMHVNSVALHPESNLLLLGSRKWSELWAVDRASGQVVWRWGNPEAYGRGTAEDRRLWGQHDAQFVPGGVLLFNNGWQRPEGSFSTVEFIAVPEFDGGAVPGPGAGTWGPEEATVLYPAALDPEFFSPNLSGVQAWPDGGLLAVEGATGRATEVDAAGEVVWSYVVPVNGDGPMAQGAVPAGNSVFRMYRYRADGPELQGRDLAPGAPIETGGDASGCTTYPGAAGAAVVEAAADGFGAFPNPASGPVTLWGPPGALTRFSVFDAAGKQVDRGSFEAVGQWDAAAASPGVYTVLFTSDALPMPRAVTVLVAPR